MATLTTAADQPGDPGADQPGDQHISDQHISDQPLRQPRATLSRARIREAQAKPRIERVYIEEWLCDAIVRVMTGAERDAYEAEITGTRMPGKGQTRVLNLSNIRARLVARCLIDDNGDPLYDWRKPADLDELGKTDAAILDRIFTAASQLNGITEKDIEELAKNSPAEANGVSGLA